MTSIEDNLIPETAVEIALLDRIKQLRIMLDTPSKLPCSYSIPKEIDLSTRDAPPMLTLAASVTSGWDQERLVITARTFGPDKASLGAHHYMPAQHLYRMTRPEAIRMTDRLHRDVMHRLAKVLGDDT